MEISPCFSGAILLRRALATTLGTLTERKTLSTDGNRPKQTGEGNTELGGR